MLLRRYPTQQVLAAHRILSAPVVVGGGGTEGSTSSGGGAAIDRAPEVAGFIDIRDLLSSFLHGGLAGLAVAAGGTDRKPGAARL